MNVASNLSDRTIARRIFLALDVVFLLFIGSDYAVSDYLCGEYVVQR